MNTHIACATNVLLLLLAALSPAHAAQPLVLGPTYPISEPHLLQMIAQRLQALERSGDMARLQEADRDRVVASARQPARIEGISTTTRPRRFHVDPSVTLTRDLLGARGERIHAAGTRINPLDIVPLPAQLMFFDGQDARQVAWAERRLRDSATPTRPVLIAGSFLDLTSRWKRQVFFDQQGRLVRQLGIRQVPALVSQDGRQLQIDELEVTP
jgi:conjugal transfer pilus assembly protein TraW